MRPVLTYAPRMQPNASRHILALTFLTLFLDLMGFAIMFPLFPAMLDYYVVVDEGRGLISDFLAFLQSVTDTLGIPSALNSDQIIVLFGGVLGSIYSAFQFVFTPILGALSDRVGRKPVLVISIAGTATSYVLWFFAGSFGWLFFARIFGGIMAANIATVSAVIADVTDAKGRVRGMTLLGIAAGLGFVLGPALGGLASLVDLTQHFPEWKAWGVNPFSAPAAVAFLLSFVNLCQVVLRFEETLPPEKRGQTAQQRSFNPAVLFRKIEYPGVSFTNWGYFLFVLVFAGMEFTLVFLAADRFKYEPHDNALMFLFIGLIVAGVQGGYVRRRAPTIGEKRMAMQGLVCQIPGFALVGLSQSLLPFYLGLFLLASGSAMVIPSLSSLVSQYAPTTEQGRILGIFRSLGALARALGPLGFCILYWQLGSTVAYVLGGIYLVLPLLLVMRLPKLEGV